MQSRFNSPFEGLGKPNPKALFFNNRAPSKFKLSMNIRGHKPKQFKILLRYPKPYRHRTLKSGVPAFLSFGFRV